MKTIPKVTFKVPPVKETLGTIWYFLDPKNKDWDWKDAVLNKYPKLAKDFYKTENTEEKKETVSEFFINFEKKNKKRIENKRKQFQKSWNKINDNFMKTLSEVVEIDWPKNCEKITAWLTLNPICPRNIQRRTFDVFYKQKTKEMKETGVHEILHFIYFEKWKQVFPNSKTKEFDYPHLVWKLSEMVPKCILGDRRIQKILKHEPEVYDIWQKTKIKNKPLLDYIQRIYDDRKDFADFLKKAYVFVKKHKKEFK